MLWRTSAVLLLATWLHIICTAAQAPAPSSGSQPGPGPYDDLDYPATGSPPLTSPQLAFDGKKEFHITVISDIHYANGTADCENVLPEQEAMCNDANSTRWMAQLLDREQPDLVVYTGDQLVHDELQNLTEANLAVLQPTIEAGVPFMSTYGNHDCEETNCRPELMQIDQESSPLSLSQYGPADLKGTGTYAYTITGNDGQPAWAIYVTDGGAYRGFGPNGDLYKGYDYIDAAQVNWYNQTSRALEAVAGRLVPAILFTHIPVPEYDIAATCGLSASQQPQMSIAQFTDAPDGCALYGTFNTTPACQAAFKLPNAATEAGTGLRLPDGAGCENATFTGVMHEGSYAAHVNGGLFAALADRGDVKLVSVGHDHINDFCSTLMGIRLCYGGGFGYHAYGLAGWPRRSRQIALSEDGSQIRTWKRLSEEGDFDIVDEEIVLTGNQGYLNYTGTPTDTGNFTAETVLGCGDYGRCDGSISGFALYSEAEAAQAPSTSSSYAG